MKNLLYMIGMLAFSAGCSVVVEDTSEIPTYTDESMKDYKECFIEACKGIEYVNIMMACIEGCQSLRIIKTKDTLNLNK